MNAGSWFNKSGAVTALTLLCVIAIVGCDRAVGDRNRRILTDSGKSVFFTDHRPFDRKLIDEDVRRLSDAISASPQDARLFVARGFLYAALTEFDNAIRDFEQAAQIAPNTDTGDPLGPKKNGAQYLLALAHWQNGSATKAIEHFSLVVGKNPDHAASRFYHGMASLEAGNRAAAVKDIEAALGLNDPICQRMCQQVLSELKGERVRERILGSYVVCLHSNKPPQSRPFGYVWEIKHEVN